MCMYVYIYVYIYTHTHTYIHGSQSKHKVASDSLRGTTSVLSTKIQTVCKNGGRPTEAARTATVTPESEAEAGG